jgi:hypothetical protein
MNEGAFQVGRRDEIFIAGLHPRFAPSLHAPMPRSLMWD